MIERLKRNHFLWYQGPMILWAVALFTQSSVPGDHIPDLAIFTHDKIIHFLIYLVFTVTVDRALAHQTRFPRLSRHHYVFTLVFVALYAASDEFHQYFVPNRSCDFFDWLADMTAAIAYAAFVWLRRRLKPAVVST